MAGDDFKKSIDGENARLNVVVHDRASGEYITDEITMTPEVRNRVIESGYLQGTLLHPDKLEEAGIEIDRDRTYLAYDGVQEALMGLYNDDIRAVVNEAERIRMEASDTDKQRVHAPEYIEAGDINGIRHQADVVIEYLESQEVDPTQIEHLIANLRDAQGLAEQVSSIHANYERGFNSTVESDVNVEADYEQFKPDVVEGEPALIIEPLK